ncbi:MAG: HEAT repeat domain-containing protein [Candidatus Helarchaeota archaeon]
MEKKFEKYFEKENIEKILKLIKKNFGKDDEQILLENIKFLEKYCDAIKENNWVFTHEILDIIFQSIYNKYWHVRQDLLILLGKLIDTFPKEFIQFNLEQIVEKMKNIFINDEDQDNRYKALQVIGKIGHLVPNKVLQFLIKQLYDPDPNVQGYSIVALKEIAIKHKGEIKEILPFLTEAFEKEQSNPNIYKVLGDAIKEISEFMYKEKITDFMTTEQVTCPYCKEFYPSTSDVCTNCGRAVAKCSICGQKLLHDAEVKSCPYCKTPFHKNHLLTWVKSNKNCPACLRSLFIEDLI